MIRYVPVDTANRQTVLSFVQAHWYETTMVVRGKTIDMAGLDGICAYDGDALIGLITYRQVLPLSGEIISLDSLRENEGIGSALLAHAIDTLRTAGSTRVVLITTNDNLRALGFYPRRGFDMIGLHRDSMDAVRRIKPDVPLIGENGIPPAPRNRIGAVAVAFALSIRRSTTGTSVFPDTSYQASQACQEAHPKAQMAAWATTMLDPTPPTSYQSADHPPGWVPLRDISNMARKHMENTVRISGIG